jgi:hypothetical protein
MFHLFLRCAGSPWNDPVCSSVDPPKIFLSDAFKRSQVSSPRVRVSVPYMMRGLINVL